MAWETPFDVHILWFLVFQVKGSSPLSEECPSAKLFVFILGTLIQQTQMPQRLGPRLSCTARRISLGWLTPPCPRWTFKDPSEAEEACFRYQSGERIWVLGMMRVWAGGMRERPIGNVSSGPVPLPRINLFGWRKWSSLGYRGLGLGRGKWNFTQNNIPVPIVSSNRQRL